MGYKKPRTYNLTPTPKHLGKAVARGGRYAIVEECMHQPTLRKYVLKKGGVLLRRELTSMCSDATASVLRSKEISDLREFTWDKLIHELQRNSPILLNILESATLTCKPRANRDAVICMCAAILLKHRFAQMCLVQKIVSLILYAGHSGKKV